MIDIKQIKGVGPKLLSNLSKLGINTTLDLINFYPFRYEILEKSKALNHDDKVIIDGVIENYATVVFLRNRKDRMKFVLHTNNKLINVCIFNRGYLKNRLIPNTNVIIIGKYDEKHNLIVASDIRFGVLPDKPIIEPIYHTVNGITSKKIRDLINKVITTDFELIDYIPSEFSTKYNFLDKKKSLVELHNPSNLSTLKKSLNRFKYEEFFLFMVKMKYLQNDSKNTLGLKKNFDFNLVKEFINSLKFKLTLDQVNAVKDIYNDFISPSQMNRLLQGDVGSGKSIVSFISLYMNYLSGYQGCLMAPTEILAKQHYNELTNLFPDINVCIVTSSLKQKERKEILSKIKNKEYDIIVGTHALFSNDVEYNNLGLVITDEQHRFGVKQRSTLKNKGITPDILYMSATPIPRTYALTIYGDMDVSNIKVLPSGRKEIITTVMEENNIKEVLQNIYRELKLNHQVYVIAPLIEESENSNLKDIELITNNMEKAFGSKYKIGSLHGKMKQDKKDEIMESFKDKKIDILVSTTVIEVGVNVPNATMMVIFDAELFGLSALHQLRGRVGRGEYQSYCILVSKNKTKRLEILEKTNDGFKISEEDFKLRGSGDLFGVRQSGEMSFKIADIKKDFSILVKARDDSTYFLNSSLKNNYPNVLNMVIKEHLD
ncbi:MAG: ATP-dependent DNA helicase RecG [Bacilli bacterium]|nr:ATP-dependent DNA helicase RecG [Bacilli bacterium]